ncbi:hypothetical protein GNI_061180 [Gregarina niphandrodes]|uniref:Uncharacterized protein n=1 Tax=Gregarina niphandrodes TaxID=110365 RepID=A0A023B8D4_GRENI|nr:hypothetical protein GNI_061180 [Gregarina niphandrodes]EZG68850.1 hypothetical protein GNI_061180 [Gregarina niphandrodes]|eukprot:XP_011134544.1 hypothetical protein GNI_061180 [Gregarina niphandrodes]
MAVLDVGAVQRAKIDTEQEDDDQTEYQGAAFQTSRETITKDKPSSKAVDRQEAATNQVPSSRTDELSAIDKAISVLAATTCGDSTVEEVTKLYYRGSAGRFQSWITLCEGLPLAEIIQAVPQPDISGSIDLATVIFRTSQKDVKYGLSVKQISNMGLSTFDSQVVYRVLERDNTFIVKTQVPPTPDSAKIDPAEAALGVTIISITYCHTGTTPIMSTMRDSQEMFLPNAAKRLAGGRDNDRIKQITTMIPCTGPHPFAMLAVLDCPAAIAGRLTKQMAGHKWANVIDRVDDGMILLGGVHPNLGKLLQWLSTHRSFYFHPHFAENSGFPQSDIPLRIRLLGLALMTVEGVYEIADNTFDITESGMRVAEGCLNRKKKSAPSKADLDRLVSHRHWQRDVLRTGRHMCAEDTIQLILGMEAKYLCREICREDKSQLALARGVSNYPACVRDRGTTASAEFSKAKVPSSKEDKLLDTPQLARIMKARAMGSTGGSVDG